MSLPPERPDVPLLAENVVTDDPVDDPRPPAATLSGQPRPCDVGGDQPELASELEHSALLRRLASYACDATGAHALRLEVLNPCGVVTRVLDEHGAETTEPLPDGELLEDVVELDGRPAVRLSLVRPEPFDDDDAQRLCVLARRAAPALRNARASLLRERRMAALEVFREIERALAASAPLDDVLLLVTRVARRLLDATGVVVLFPHPGELHEVRAGVIARDSQVRMRTLFAEVQPELEEIVATGTGRTLHLDGEMVVAVPVESVDEERHFLGVWFAGRRDELDDHERSLVDIFVDQVSSALTRTRFVQHRERVAVREERDRVARDLHDVVIQRIFASGLLVKALARNDDFEQMRTGLQTVADDLDVTIGDIRSAIFELTHAVGPGLRQEVRALTGEYARILGFSPWVCTEGDLTRIEPTTGRHLLATMRELLSNVARHAEASSCRVEVVQKAGWVRLEVSDDGRGIAPGTPRSGLDNVALRASLLGGSLDVEPRATGGTLVTWRVPVVSIEEDTVLPG